MQRRLSLSQEEKGVAPEQVVVVAVRRLGTGRLVPDAGVGYGVSPQPHLPGPGAPVRLLPVGEVVLVQESHSLQSGAPYQHTGAICIVPLLNTAIWPLVKSVPPYLPGRAHPGIHPPAGGLDDPGPLVVADLGAKGGTVRGFLSGLHQHGEKGWIDNRVVVQQEDVVCAVRQGAAHAHVAPASESHVLCTGDELDGVAEPVLTDLSIVPRGAIVYNDGLVVGVRHGPKGLQALTGVGETVPVEDNYGNFGRTLHGCRPNAVVGVLGMAAAGETGKRLTGCSHPPTIDHLRGGDKRRDVLLDVTAI